MYFIDFLKLYFLDKTKIKTFSFDKHKTIAYVTKVYDGDTITLIFKYGGKTYKQSCRLYGIDTPEMDTGANAQNAKEYLSNKVLNKYVKVHFFKMDKYKRPLIKVYKYSFFSHKSYNEKLIEKGLAVAYFGGKK